MGVIAVYLRLSLEDRPDGGDDVAESNSISSQRALIHSYIEQDAELKEFDVAEFCDDGWSGSEMDRPGMNRLLGEVKKNRVQCIITTAGNTVVAQLGLTRRSRRCCITCTARIFRLR